jgi:hypothetical protein
VTLDDEPIRASMLSATVEWRTVHPGAEIVWDDSKDAEPGVGLVDFDPSASVVRWFQVADRWPVVAGGYRQRMGAFGWDESEKIVDRWWEWSRQDQRGDTFDLIMRTPGTGMFWPSGIRDGMTVFEVRFVRCRPPTDVLESPVA